MVPTPAPSLRPRRSADDVKAALLAAAVAELDEVGPTRASLRSIARRVGITHQAVAYHYRDRTALFTALATDGFEALMQRCREAVAAVDPAAPLGQTISALGVAYVQFARANRSQFGLMFGSSLVEPLDADLMDAKLRNWDLHLRTVAAVAEQGWGGDVPAPELATACWALAHGLATLEGDMPGGMPVEASVEAVLHVVNAAIIS